MGMTYRGRVSGGVVQFEGEAPAEGIAVEVVPAIDDESGGGGEGGGGGDPATHPAVGLWRDRTDLPEDAGEASGVLRERMMGRADG